MKWRPYLLVFLFLLILIVIGIAYYSGKSQGLAAERENVNVDTTAITSTNAQEKLKFVNTETVELQTYAIEIEALGRVSSTQAISVMAEVQGALLAGNVPIKKGTSFTKGQVLFSINSNDASLLIAARKSNFLTLLANILPDIKVDYPAHYEVWNMFFDNIDMDRPLPPIPPLVSSKLKTLLQMLSIAILLTGESGNKLINFQDYNAQTIGIILLWLSAFLTLYTGYDYVRKGIDHAINEDNKNI